MKVLIQGLGEAPATIELALGQEKPEITYIICSDYQLAYTFKGYTKPNRQVVTEAARKVKAKVVFKRCNVFDPASIAGVILEIMERIDPLKDEVIINYAGGSAPVRLFLGVLGVELARFAAKTKILYAIRYPGDLRLAADQTRQLQEFLPTHLNLLLGYVRKRMKAAKSR